VEGERKKEQKGTERSMTNKKKGMGIGKGKRGKERGKGKGKREDGRRDQSKKCHRQ